MGTTDPLAVLGTDVFLLVLEQLDVRDLVASSGVSTLWRTFIAPQQRTWRRGYLRSDVDPGDKRRLRSAASGDVDWRQLCVDRVRSEYAWSIGRFRVETITAPALPSTHWEDTETIIVDGEDDTFLITGQDKANGVFDRGSRQLQGALALPEGLDDVLAMHVPGLGHCLFLVDDEDSEDDDGNEVYHVHLWITRRAWDRFAPLLEAHVTLVPETSPENEHAGGLVGFRMPLPVAADDFWLHVDDPDGDPSLVLVQVNEDNRVATFVTLNRHGREIHNVPLEVDEDDDIYVDNVALDERYCWLDTGAHLHVYERASFRKITTLSSTRLLEAFADAKLPPPLTYSFELDAPPETSGKCGIYTLKPLFCPKILETESGGPATIERAGATAENEEDVEGSGDQGSGDPDAKTSTAEPATKSEPSAPPPPCVCGYPKAYPKARKGPGGFTLVDRVSSSDTEMLVDGPAVFTLVGPESSSDTEMLADGSASNPLQDDEEVLDRWPPATEHEGETHSAHGHDEDNSHEYALPDDDDDYDSILDYTSSDEGDGWETESGADDWSEDDETDDEEGSIAGRFHPFDFSEFVYTFEVGGNLIMSTNGILWIMRDWHGFLDAAAALPEEEHYKLIPQHSIIIHETNKGHFGYDCPRSAAHRHRFAINIDNDPNVLIFDTRTLPQPAPFDRFNPSTQPPLRVLAIHATGRRKHDEFNFNCDLFAMDDRRAYVISDDPNGRRGKPSNIGRVFEFE